MFEIIKFYSISEVWRINTDVLIMNLATIIYLITRYIKCVVCLIFRNPEILLGMYINYKVQQLTIVTTYYNEFN